MHTTSWKGTLMKKEVKEEVNLMTSHKDLSAWQLPSLTKKSALMQIQKDRVSASIEEVYARIEKHRASSAQKDKENHENSN